MAQPAALERRQVDAAAVAASTITDESSGIFCLRIFGAK
jgi:hypothetical protein